MSSPSKPQQLKSSDKQNCLTWQAFPSCNTTPTDLRSDHPKQHPIYHCNSTVALGADMPMEYHTMPGYGYGQPLSSLPSAYTCTHHLAVQEIQWTNVSEKGCGQRSSDLSYTNHVNGQTCQGTSSRDKKRKRKKHSFKKNVRKNQSNLEICYRLPPLPILFLLSDSRQ